MADAADLELTLGNIPRLTAVARDALKRMFVEFRRQSERNIFHSAASDAEKEKMRAGINKAFLDPKTLVVQVVKAIAVRDVSNQIADTILSCMMTSPEFSIYPENALLLKSTIQDWFDLRYPERLVDMLGIKLNPRSLTVTFDRSVSDKMLEKMFGGYDELVKGITKARGHIDHSKQHTDRWAFGIWIPSNVSHDLS